MGDRAIRPAAALIAAREGARGPEVLVLRRAGAHRFLPGYVVFPGGAVDPGDAELAERWFGRPGEAARACAVRELLEEAGLALTAAGLRPAGDLGAVDAAPPRVGDLREVSRWVAPEHVPVRFDARFFAVRAEDGVEPGAASPEVAEAWWARPADLLEGWSASRVLLYWPTMKLLEGLAGSRSVAELLATWVPQREPVGGEEEAMPRSTFSQEA
ncbi:MAG TPA: NUDIX domain-containing protein [Actinomycetota bacterium]|nr:NUDIX domain-containing protein [Actinomycetota bacterium]